MKGKIYKLASGLIVVPFEFIGGGYNCVVIKGSVTYKVGGYNIFVIEKELEEGIILQIIE